jgi:hypothetical protein
MVSTPPAISLDFPALQPGSCESTGCPLPAPERLWVPPASGREVRRQTVLRRLTVCIARMDLGLQQAARVAR